MCHTFEVRLFHKYVNQIKNFHNIFSRDGHKKWGGFTAFFIFLPMIYASITTTIQKIKKDKDVPGKFEKEFFVIVIGISMPESLFIDHENAIFVSTF